MDRLNRTFFRNFWRLAKPYWYSEEKWHAYSLLTAVVVITLIFVGSTVLFNFWQKSFFDALQNFAARQLIKDCFVFVGVMGLMLLSFGYLGYVSGVLTNHWRRWLTQYYLQRWTHNHNCYVMQTQQQEFDNPDQRISQDLYEFPNLILTLLNGLLSSIVAIASFSYILWHNSTTLSVPLSSFGIIHIHGYLFWLAVLVATIGSWLVVRVARPLVKYNYMQERYTADFRFNMARTREYSEQVAFNKLDKYESQRLRKRFKPVFNNYARLIKIEKNYNFLKSGYNSMGYISGFIAGLPLYLSKQIQLGGLTQIGGAFANILGAMSYILIRYKDIANLQAVTGRLIQFEERLTGLEKQKTENNSLHIQRNYPQQLHIKLSHLNCPDGQTLFAQLDLRIIQGQHTLLSAPSGSGKSTLLKVIAGMWPYASGNLCTAAASDMMFLAQKPYLPIASLREIAIAQRSNNAQAHAALARVFKQVQLEYLLPHLDEERHWSQALSLGEQQALHLARVLLQKPLWVFLDEATSALDIEREKLIYQALLALPNTTIVSVGHRASLTAFHVKTIELLEFSPKVALISRAAAHQGNVLANADP